jgi:hypothetical protein
MKHAGEGTGEEDHFRAQLRGDAGDDSVIELQIHTGVSHV